MIRTPATRKVYRKVKKTILIDSRDRDPRFTQSRYTVKLPRVYENVYSVALKTAEIPFTWYSFSQSLGNASFVMEAVGTTPTGPQTVIIPDGNYSCDSFLCALTDALNGIYGPNAFTVSYCNTTNLLTIVALNPEITSFTLYFNPISDPQKQSFCDNNYVGLVTPTTTWWGLGYFMGFYRRDYTSSSNLLGGSQHITAEFPAQFNPHNYIIMELEFLNKQDETSIDGRLSGRVDGCFAKIQIPGNSCNTIFYREMGCCNVNESTMSPPLSQLNQITVKWRFHDGRPINFNNIDHSFSLEFTLLENNFDEYSSLDFTAL
jgi:hypothetical protein